MDEFLQEIYLGQLKQECERCFAAIGSMNAIANNDFEGDFFQFAFELVHHAAAVSRMLWPPGGKNKNSRQRAFRRGDFLRMVLDVKAGHPVQERSLRDHFEHFDERLDDWAENSRHRNIVHHLIGPRSSIGGNSIQDSDIIHHYDPRTRIFAFRGEKFNVQALADGLDDLYRRLTAKLAALEATRPLRTTTPRAPFTGKAEYSRR